MMELLQESSSDVDPKVDDCSGKGVRMQMTGKNVGELLNAKGITWGWFQGGFKPSNTRSKSKSVTERKML